MIAVLAMLLAVAWLTRRAPPPTERAAAEQPAPTPRVDPPPPPVAATPAPVAEAAARTAPAEPEPELASIDVERLRARLPDHPYWRWVAPTNDPELLRARAAHDRELNELYGKVLSGTGTDDDIRRYFDERRRVSEDAISFAKAALEDLGSDAAERDRGLLELAITLHTARLEELPRRQDEAFARKREQDARREAWRRTGR
jgi:hypothetical protein